MNFPIRYVARIVVEAETPLAIGSDSLLFDQDAPVEKDCNGLPYIPGTAITGFLRNILKDLDKYFGEEPDSISDQPLGSNFVTSDAYLVDDACQVHQKPEIISNKFLLRYHNLPIRQHVAINAFGAAEDHSLFDQEIVFKGSRFKFEISLELKVKNDAVWKAILNAFNDNDFYLGGGSFNNFGELKVIDIFEKCYNLSTDLDTYLELTVDLNQSVNGLLNVFNKEQSQSYKLETIKLTGKDSFFHFGAGLGDNEVDKINYKEDIIIWNNNKPVWETRFVIIGTSIKGAIAHRVAYHYNKTNNYTIEELVNAYVDTSTTQLNKSIDLDNFKLASTIEELEQQKLEIEEALNALNKEKIDFGKLLQKYMGTNNNEVAKLFGSAKSNEKTGNAGTVIFKDVYLPIGTKEVIFYHNKIDRYTQGTIASALFSEKVLVINNIELTIKSKEAITKNSCFDLALSDLKKGLLPVGGLVNKGHGIFVEQKTT